MFRADGLKRCAHPPVSPVSYPGGRQRRSRDLRNGAWCGVRRGVRRGIWRAGRRSGRREGLSLLGSQRLGAGRRPISPDHSDRQGEQHGDDQARESGHGGQCLAVQLVGRGGRLRGRELGRQHPRTTGLHIEIRHLDQEAVAQGLSECDRFLRGRTGHLQIQDHGFRHDRRDNSSAEHPWVDGGGGRDGRDDLVRGHYLGVRHRPFLEVEVRGLAASMVAPLGSTPSKICAFEL